MHESLLLGVATVFVLGLGAQWLAPRGIVAAAVASLFGPAVTFVDLDERFQQGAEVRTIPITDRDTFGHLTEVYGDVVTPLFLTRGSSLFVFSQRASNPTPQAGDRLVAIVGPGEEEDQPRFTEDGLLLLSSDSTPPAIDEAAEEPSPMDALPRT